MILDYNYNKNRRTLSVSYITPTGGKKVMDFNVNRFKTYTSTVNGKYENWDGSRCDIRWVDNPDNFDIKTYFKEMDPKYRALLAGKDLPKVYTFDIEVEISEEFPEPSEAKYPITTISIASPDCNVIILGTKELNDESNLQSRFDEYLNSSKFFKGLGLPQPKIKYIKFDCEKDMLEYFLKNIVAKVPILAGWNSIMFDWYYIQNRIRGYYSSLSLINASINQTVTVKNYTDMRGEKVRLTMPNHTLILDMMDVVGTFDMAVMPIKESLSLDYIASESIGMNKIKYDGDLQQLFENDYSTYVFYNAIDSILVQLIDKKFRTLNNIYAQSLICEEKIGACFSKIAITEALFFNYFYEHNIKVVPTKPENEGGVLVGAYVAKPVAGKHNWVCCNDFASLYPSVIRTCNISIENFVGTFYDKDALKKYESDEKNYMVVGGTVYKNAGTLKKPKLGDLVCRCLLEDELDVYRRDPNYFVSVNGHVYKNDKDYAFKNIQSSLANNRNSSKYLAKQLDALVISDIDHIIKNNIKENHGYPSNIIEHFKTLGLNITCTNDLLNIVDLDELKTKIKNEITHLTSFEQACKTLMNSMYGGCSHQAFFWRLLPLANDITGEARNLIHLMENHIPSYVNEKWSEMAVFHNKWNIKVDKNVKDYISICYGDTDSVVGSTIIHTNNGDRTIEELFNENYNNDRFYTHNGHELVSMEDKILNWDNGLYYGDVKYIMRHKVSKPKWRLKTKSGKEVIVTNDHSMIVFRDGEKIEVKPYEILPTDKILVING